MASAWDIPVVDWAIIMVGWWISPIIAFFLRKIFSYIEFDASQKVRQLKIHIMPDLENTLLAVDQERMLERGEKPKSTVSTLDDMAGLLRRAREEAEDIFDDHQEIDLYHNRWSQRLYGAMEARVIIGYGGVSTCIGRCLRFLQKQLHQLTEKVGPRLNGAVAICKSSFLPLLQWSQKIIAWLRSEDGLPVTATGVGDSHEPVSETTSESSWWWLSWLCSFFDFINNRLCMAVGFAYFLRDWSYEVICITSNQENASVLDSLIATLSRRNLKKRIEKIESTISEVMKSSLLGIASKRTPEDIANKNRSRIRTPNNRKVFGRKALLANIMSKLREIPQDDVSSSSTSLCYSVIGIHGVSGSGKTTFAQYTRDYIKEECKDILFDAVMCIHVSETFSVDDIFHEMLKDVTKDPHSNVSDREELEEKVKQSLRGKRFYLILDDLWVKNKNDPQLEELISPLSVGLKGSKILVTARTKVAAGALCADEPIKIPELDKDQYLSMFMHYALGGTSVADEEYKRVGKVIAKKLHGSPIAAVIVAGQLGANRDISFWENTAKLDMLNGTMDALWWSYQQLSPDIKRCFEYCNMFPRRFKMKKSDLVHLWIAQGYVKTSCAREDMEDVAEGYIQELVSCSFLQPERTWDDVECFRIHDLLHELADMVTRTDSFRIENKSNQRGECWKGDIPRDVRHIFIQNYDAELIFDEIFGFRYLRTLIINDFEGDTQVLEKMMENICMKLPKLRVLAFYLSNESIKKRNKFSFPESIGQLKYLRYLAFRAKIVCKITLPSTINKLHHIQLLDFGDGDILEFTFAELVNLRHIFCGPYVKLAYVGRMNLLQTLPGFNVSNEQGCELKQLRDLNKLQGKLRICGLESVKSKEQALQANLTAKERLTQLSLLWAYDNDRRCSREVEADVLEGLCPPVGLQKLELWYFAGCRYPDWMVGKHSRGPKYLQELRLFSCSQPGPASGLAEAFPYLRVIRFQSCSWDDLPDNMEHLISLRELVIFSCKNIRSLPSLPQSLEEFELWNCNYEFMKSCQTTGHANWLKIEHIPTKYFNDIRMR